MRARLRYRHLARNVLGSRINGIREIDERRASEEEKRQHFLHNDCAEVDLEQRLGERIEQVLVGDGRVYPNENKETPTLITRRPIVCGETRYFWLACQALPANQKDERQFESDTT